MTIELQLVSLFGLATLTVGTAYVSLIQKGISNHALKRLETTIYGLLVASVALFVMAYNSAQ